MPKTSGFAIGDRVAAKADGREMEVVSVRPAGAGTIAIYCAWEPQSAHGVSAHRVIRRFLPDQIAQLPRQAKPGGARALKGKAASNDPTDDGRGDV